jgi:hypothetical protein
MIMIPLIALSFRPWYYGALRELVPFAAAVILIVIVCKRSKKDAPLWGRAGMGLNLLAAAIGGIAASLTYFTIATMPSVWNSPWFWDLWEDNLRWDWWTRGQIMFSILFAPLGMLAGALLLEFAMRLFHRSPAHPAKGPSN